MTHFFAIPLTEDVALSVALTVFEGVSYPDTRVSFSVRSQRPRFGHHHGGNIERLPNVDVSLRVNV